MIAWRSRSVDTLVVLLFVAGILCLARAVSGCALLPPKETREHSAEAMYTADHMACVDTFQTRKEIDECREGVRLRWGRYRDGGVR